MATIVDLTRSSPPIIPASKEESSLRVFTEAIKSARRRRLRKTIYKLCHKSPEAARIAASLLLVSIDKAEMKRKRQSKAEAGNKRARTKNERSERTKRRGEDHDEDDSSEKEKIDEDGESDDDGDDDDDDDDDSSHDDEDDYYEEEAEDEEDLEEAVDRRLLEMNSKHTAIIISNHHKGVRPRFAICENCTREFNVTRNEKAKCYWHDGMIANRLKAVFYRPPVAKCKTGILEADMEGDFWADHDEDCHGIIDSRELQEEYPEGYKYQCCGKENKTRGCRTGRHVERK